MNFWKDKQPKVIGEGMSLEEAKLADLFFKRIV